jgi:tetratricopeptide (TPR) repeat protein
MKIKMFMSFAGEDLPFINELCEKIKSELPEIEPVIVSYEKEAGVAFSRKISAYLEGCKWFFVLLTENSILNQWVNQEIGYAFSLKKYGSIEEIIPVVERKIEGEKENLIDIKGLINKEIESVSFIRSNKEKSFKNIIGYLNNALKQSNKPETLKIEEETALLEEEKDYWEAAKRLNKAVDLYLEKNDLASAIEKWNKVADLYKLGNYQWEEGDTKKQIAEHYNKIGDYKNSIRYYEESGNILMKDVEYWEAAKTFQKGSKIATANKLYDKTIELYEKAKDAYEEGGNEHEANLCRNKIHSLKEKFKSKD